MLKGILRTNMSRLWTSKYLVLEIMFLDFFPHFIQYTTYITKLAKTRFNFQNCIYCTDAVYECMDIQ